MKRIIIISAVFLSLSVVGQIKSENPKTIDEKDQSFKVIYLKEDSAEKKPAYFLNGKHVNESFLASIQPEVIDDIKVEKGNIEIDKVQYFGKILVKTKKNFKPNLMSLIELKQRYINCNEQSIVFQIDDEIINAGYDKYLVEVNFILKITVDKLENLNLSVIKIYTKSIENIKKENEIRIRGTVVEKIN